MTWRRFLRKLAVDIALVPVFLAAVAGILVLVFWLVTTLTPPVTP